ncbi:hypothetical protein R1flu_026852 [Riccia fluitans]|uniref:Uncharacterized protein n=1 Tax=Riccia fluitans TaxID=41844 RepID=A0ABD1XHQ5_9MARC
MRSEKKFERPLAFAEGTVVDLPSEGKIRSYVEISAAVQRSMSGRVSPASTEGALHFQRERESKGRQNCIKFSGRPEEEMAGKPENR